MPDRIVSARHAFLDTGWTNGQFYYVYLCSAAHSGSTLVACLLGAHPKVTTVGEFGATVPKTYLCSCGSRLFECKFWQDWKSHARAKGIDFEIGNLGINLEPVPNAGFYEKLFYHQFPLKFLDRLRDFIYANRARQQHHAQKVIEKSVQLAGALCRHQKTSVFLDTTKNPLQIRFLARHPQIRLKMIALIRDGRGVIDSLIRKEEWSPQESVASWLWSNRHIHRATRYLPNADIYWLRLEDLCRKPEDTIKALFRFCGISPCWPLDYSNPAQQHIIGNSMRLHFDGKIRYDQTWRETLSAKYLELFDRRAGWLNKHFGYGD